MFHEMQNEQSIVHQAIAILDSKLKIKTYQFDRSSLMKDFLRLQLELAQREQMSACYLDSQLRLIEYKIVFSGLLTFCPVSSREFIKDALALNAASIILVHNHPSGDATPSRDDIKVTFRIKKALELFEIKLIDHFVVGHNQISSMKELNLL